MTVNISSDFQLVKQATKRATRTTEKKVVRLKHPFCERILRDRETLKIKKLWEISCSLNIFIKTEILRRLRRFRSQSTNEYIVEKRPPSWFPAIPI